jgi:hypothetical protein
MNQYDITAMNLGFKYDGCNWFALDNNEFGHEVTLLVIAIFSAI